ncbi:hypothetical protein C3747_12g409 [Trypanosoma cruzi]|uniref:Survival motor neuron Tudor domain-containing protein n=2 Tax=Trypanosoma cruzi TaxID=5693 RepID=Q4D4J3_TRYCC|nr:hypothetical protein, conserved [Trypanosoma cruzi]EAN87442.1 hypothetical protein, conserved [Trypanosoma cruzi]PWV18777.1 hypothetical protein C3747_12g409 [Trypanosoma cruzi]RNC37409.1 hypothetical protein TcCL_NonESM13426 [Trypanosoma cruzi]|eukprot:XP_809293.1 hypothetical protein [Trypanosoma cruzi strain CL Brener]
MDRSAAKRAGNSQGSTAVYQRGKDDESLWDDAELIRLWNMQLEKKKEEDAAPQLDELRPLSSDDDSMIASLSGEDMTETSSSSTPLPNTAKKVVPPVADTGAFGLDSSPLQQDGMRGLPAEIQRVASAYYRAGYEAGYFVGRREKVANKTNPKKRRGKK